jgi:hypothetical protein
MQVRSRRRCECFGAFSAFRAEASSGSACCAKGYSKAGGEYGTQENLHVQRFMRERSVRNVARVYAEGETVAVSEDEIIDAAIEGLCGPTVCRCCHRQLHGNSKSEWCGRRACVRMRLKEDSEYKAAKYAKNNKWHAKKYASDKEWAEKRKGRAKIRSAANV